MTGFKKGDLVFGKVKNIWYPGKVGYVEEKDNTINVEYEDGVSEWISDLSRIQKNLAFQSLSVADLQTGDRIIGNWKGRNRWYEGKVKKINKKEQVFVKYDDGDSEWIEDLSKIRKTEKFNDTTLLEFSKGDRVIGNWLKQNQWYPGFVRVVSDGRINVQYDDGDSEWIEDPSRIQKDNSIDKGNDISKEGLYR